MVLEMFPNEYLEVLYWVINDNPDEYKLISSNPKDKGHTDIEIEGINEPFDLLALGIRIGMSHSDKTAIDRVVPAVLDLVKKDLDSKISPSTN
jgi:hypothetical protein